MNRYRTLVGLTMLAGATALACFTWIPLPDLVAKRPVIVIGMIEQVDAAPAPQEGESQYPYDIARLKVTKVLKNTLPDMAIKVGDKLPLATPSVRRKSTDIIHAKGKDGIWLLEFKDGKYMATYPGDFQPKEKEDEIVKLLSPGA